MFIPNTVLTSRCNKWLFTLALVGCITPKIWAQETAKPLFEMGIGIGAVNQPFYPGSGQQRNIVFPAPVPIYRGKVFKSDSRGIRAEVVDEPRYRLDISADINFAINSDDIDAREGMADIDTMLQIGPSFQIDLYDGATNRIKLNLPLRFNLGVSWQGVSDSGFTFAPNVSFHHGFQWRETPWLASVSAGPQFGSQQFHDVYYHVADRYATAERAAYRADAGYSGSRITASIRSRTDQRLWVLFARYDHLSGAEFEDSPLVETNCGLSVGFIYSRFVFRSKTTVSRDDEKVVRR